MQSEGLSLNEKHEIANTLNKIKVSLNPSGYIFINHIIKHYEYFSLKTTNTTALFATIGYLIKKDNSVTFDFAENLNKTFITTKECILSLKRFLDAEYEVAKDFEVSNHVFRTYFAAEGDIEDYYESRIGRLLLVRIIHTHISYIDDFRLYILQKQELWNELGKKGINIHIAQKEANQILLQYIQKYAYLLKGTKGEVGPLIDLAKQNLKSIIKDGKTYNQVVQKN